MTIAWATIILVALLLPGFLFIAGFYFQERVTRETTPISALGQLALVVGISFFVHSSLYYIINIHLCPTQVFGVACVAIDHFASIFNLEASMSVAGKLQATREMLDYHIFRILMYFLSACLLGFIFGILAGKIIEKGFLKKFTKHQWMSLLNAGRRDASNQKKVKRVRVNVLSKSGDKGCILVYTGMLEDFYARADGTISQLVISEASKGFIDIKKAGRQETIKIEPLSVQPTTGQEFLVLTSNDIANVFFQSGETPVSTTEEELSALKQKVEEIEKSEPQQ